MRRPFILYAVAVLLCSLGARGEGTSSDERHLSASSYAISQTHALKVRNDLLVDVTFSITFHVPEGNVLKSCRKTILSAVGTQGVVGDVKAVDASGRVLPVRADNNGGWLRVEFDFAEPVDGSVNPNYHVDLTYTVSNGICATSATAAGVKLDLPWAHRWIARVIESKYEISFEDSSTRMQDVCLNSFGFRPRCGAAGLALSGSTASHKVDGMLHQVSFDWKGQDASFRLCPGVEQSTTAAPATRVDEVNAQALPEEDEPASASMAIGIVAFGASAFVFAGTGFLVYKKRSSSQKSKKSSFGDEVDAHFKVQEGLKSKLKDKLELDFQDQPSVTESTVASLRDSPSRRYMIPDSPQPNQSGTPFGTPFNRSTPRAASLFNSPPLSGKPKDMGAGVGSWDVLDEFDDTELAVLNENDARAPAIHVSDHTAEGARELGASLRGDEGMLFGKPSWLRSGSATPLSHGSTTPRSEGNATPRSFRQQTLGADSLQHLPWAGEGVSEEFKAAISDRFAVGSDCDDEVVQDDTSSMATDLHSSLSRNPSQASLGIAETDQYAVDDDCDDEKLEERSTASISVSLYSLATSRQVSEAPTMAVENNAVAHQLVDWMSSLRGSAQLEAREAAVAAAPPSVSRMGAQDLESQHSSSSRHTPRSPSTGLPGSQAMQSSSLLPPMPQFVPAASGSSSHLQASPTGKQKKIKLSKAGPVPQPFAAVAKPSAGVMMPGTLEGNSLPPTPF